MKSSILGFPAVVINRSLNRAEARELSAYLGRFVRSEQNDEAIFQLILLAAEQGWTFSGESSEPVILTAELVNRICEELRSRSDKSDD